MVVLRSDFELRGGNRGTNESNNMTKTQSGWCHQDDRAKNESKHSQISDHKMGSRGPFGMFGI